MSLTDEIIKSFTSVKSWQSALISRNEVDDQPAVYALVFDAAIPRLVGETRILYIGQTKCLGGKSDRARLYAYRYPSGNHSRLMKLRTNKLLEMGHSINLHWLNMKSEDEAKQLESSLLAKHMSEHLEFPPFNGAS